MTQGPAGSELVDVIKRRIDVLEECRSAGLDKRELVDELPQSRSTINRALQELETLGLVHYEEGGYTTATAGQLAAQAYHDLLDQLDAIAAAQPILEALPDSLALEPAVLTDAEIHVAEPPSPAAALKPIVELVEGARRLRGLVVTEAGPDLIEPIQMRVMAGDLVCEYVLSPGLVEHMETDRADIWAQVLATGRLDYRVHPDLDADLRILEGDDWTAMALLAYEDRTNLRGVIVNDDPTAVRWAERLFDTHWTEADPPDEE